MKTSPALGSIGALAASALLLAGCSAPAPTDGGDDSRLSVVASTNVYGDLAATIGGDLVDVTSIITGANQDPHSFEASARDQLAVSEADLVILNGGGYDPFMETLVEASGTSAPVIEAVEASGLLDEDHADDDHADEPAEDHTDEPADGHDGHDHIEGFNEHVWYDLHGMVHVVEHIAEELAAIDAANADTYTANAEALAADIESLESRADELHTALEGQGAAMTEPVPAYLLAAVGLDNLTPEAFTEAIEEGADVPPVALQETLDLFADNAVVVLAYNSQTASPETERVRAAAEDAGVPVLDFTETLPDGQTYVSWMTANLDAIQAALT
ncbi:metal ABC transporter solute-binding protein, Zn/Mn family [Salinibacterium soli]|uniref:Zinc ABC transporter substrate-binding protein n=1 Tax=Antiquaquibacter soli TaxID=3064523 RepID=A0ABT9BQ39_9MICO|nr:zinc ABC transporter substrate-binding protein [Protaetiibacter sp. WY-16]MDO7883138.1 zinc ABC transporter substrate-binding protein [Protaetiibacter sp. WY-16]